MTKYQLFDALSKKDYQALKADIAVRGIIVPVEIDEHGNILDGHHRVRAWTELKAEHRVNGADYPRIVRAGMTEKEKRNHVRALNLIRRHLTKEKRKQIWADMRADGMTYEAIAQATGVSDETVRKSASNLLEAASVKGKDGKRYPSRYKPRKPKPSVFVKTDGEQRRAIEAIATKAELPGKMIDVKRAERIAREQSSSKKALAVSGADVKVGSARLLLGDMRERGSEIDECSVDLVFTDPPYPKENLPLWSDLSSLAARVMKPAGMLVAYTGAMYLPEVIARLSENLTFYWAGAVVLDGAHSRIHSKNVVQGSKPLLFFVSNNYYFLSSF